MNDTGRRDMVFLNLFSCVVGGVGIYAGGILRDAKVDLSRMFQFAALAAIVCAIILFALNRKLKRNSKA